MLLSKVTYEAESERVREWEEAEETDRLRGGEEEQFGEK